MFLLINLHKKLNPESSQAKLCKLGKKVVLHGRTSTACLNFSRLEEYSVEEWALQKSKCKYNSMNTLVLTYDFKCVFDSLPRGEKQWWIGLLQRFVTTESTLQVLNYVICNNKNWYPAKFVKFQPCLIIQCRFSSYGFLPPSFFHVTFDQLGKFKARVLEEFKKHV